MIYFLNHKWNWIVIFILFTDLLFAQLTINVTSIPVNTPASVAIYIASSFNNWNPGDNDAKLTRNSNGTYQITFTPSVGILEYKFTRGDWATVEGDAQGNQLSNRSYSYTSGQQSIDVSILTWEDGGSGNGSRSDNVTIIDENFNIPQLNRTRRVWIYLPLDYVNTTESYPVLYMQDGQNLFDVATSFSGEWEVDESLNILFGNGDKGVIVVGIDNGGEKRIDEYSPWVNNQYGGGEGDKYIDFIVETLKPYIDANYRTLTDRLHTGIMGSSLGALISFYGAIEHQDTFSKVGVFSPSFWFSDEVYTHVATTGKKYDMRFYFLGGEQESTSIIPDMEKMVTTLKTAGFTDNEIIMVTNADGEHSEWYWRREFPEAYEWLYANAALDVPVYSNEKGFIVFPNPTQGTFKINKQVKQIEIYNLIGRKVKSFSGDFNSHHAFNMSTLKPSIYIVKIKSDIGTSTKRLVIE